jgi:hypothetical protein
VRIGFEIVLLIMNFIPGSFFCINHGIIFGKRVSSPQLIRTPSYFTV